jgi:hypothetical protein
LQKGEPFNYFIYPYAELDGKPFSGLQSHFLFRALAPAVTSAAAGAAASRQLFEPALLVSPQAPLVPRSFSARGRII